MSLLPFLSPISGHKRVGSIPRPTLVLIAILLLIISLLWYFKLTYQPKNFSTYQECTNDPGSIIQESYPATCITSSGQSFTQPLNPTPAPKLPNITPIPSPALLINPQTGQAIHRFDSFSLETPTDWQATNTPDRIILTPSTDIDDSSIEIHLTDTTVPLNDYLAEQKQVALELAGPDLVWQQTPITINSVSATKVTTNVAGYLALLDIPNTQKRLEIAVIGDISTQESSAILNSIDFLSAYCPAICPGTKQTTCPADSLRYTIDDCSCPADVTCEITPTLILTTKSDCIVTGCNNEICSDQEVMSTCEFSETSTCYQNATCERQTDGQCGWTITESLQTCLTAGAQL